jgi:cytochrome c oxidase subunit 4
MTDSPASHGDASPRPARHAHPNYIGIWLMLFVLTAIELGVAFLPFSKTVIILLLLLLAFWKAGLVALYYMHLRFEPNRLRILAVAPLPLIVILVVAVIQEYR